MPLPGTKVIPDGWSEHHRPVANGSMTAVCRITRDVGEPVYNPTTGNVTQQTATIYEGPCRVQQLEAQATQVEQADQTIASANYLVVIRWESDDIRVGDNGDRLTLVECEEDVDLVGKPLRLVSAIYGSLRWERDLYCSMDLVNTSPKGV